MRSPSALDLAEARQCRRLHKHSPTPKQKFPTTGTRRDWTTLTITELFSIDEQLKNEKLLASKCRAYAQLCKDPELRKKCETLSGKHQAHYDTLLSMLSQEAKQ